jgi:homoserine O-acetyltransferase/O-succinyltransferase
MKSLLIIAMALFVSQLNAQCILKTASLGDFKTISGKEIRNCIIAYRTIGKLNADKSNVVLWTTWHQGQSDIICNGIAAMTMDTTGLYIIVADALGNGVSSSPSNNPGFPEITIRDMVNSQHILLTRHMAINHVKAVMGISMGGMQTMEWMVAYPGFLDLAISIVGTPKQSAYDLMLWKTDAALLTAAEKNGTSKEEALRMVSNVDLLNTYSPSYWYQTTKPEKVDSIMLAEQENILHSIKPDDNLCQLNAMIGHDIYKSSGKELGSIKEVIKAKVLIIVSRSDHMVNPGNSVELSNAIGAKLVQLENDGGHLGIYFDQALIKDEVIRFLKN